MSDVVWQAGVAGGWRGLMQCLNGGRVLLALLTWLGAAAAVQAMEQRLPSAGGCPAPATVLSASALQAAQNPQAPDRGLLWLVEKDGRRSWLYGTMHLGRSDWVAIGPQLQQALQQARVLALEVDLTDSRTLATLQSSHGRGVPPLPEQERRRVSRQLSQLCLPEQTLGGTAPHMQAAALVVLAARKQGLYAEYGSERVLATLAKIGQKRVVAIERAGDQMQLLKGDSPQADVQQVQAALDELESGRVLAQLGELSEVWSRGDVDRLSRYNDWCNCIHSEADLEAQRRLLDLRNGPMADAFERLHAKGEPVLLAVGALHAVGPEGLVALLSRRGFVVRHLPNAAAQPVPPQLLH